MIRANSFADPDPRAGAGPPEVVGRFRLAPRRGSARNVLIARRPLQAVLAPVLSRALGLTLG
jgi:hypothetical protein